MRKNQFNLIFLVIFSLLLTNCATLTEVKAEFPPSRIDIYVIDVSKSIVKDKNNSSQTLFERVDTRIRQDISNNAVGSPSVMIGDKSINSKPALGLYVQLMGDRAGENSPQQIRSPQNSEELWRSVQQMNLNDVNTVDLWAKIQEISTQILDESNFNECKNKVMIGLKGQSGKNDQKENIASLLCETTIGSVEKINKFKSDLEVFLSTPYQDTGSPGTPGSDIFGTIKNLQGWIKTISDSSEIKPSFNIIFLSDMVHDADQDQNLNSILPNLAIDEIKNKAKSDSNNLDSDFANFDLNVFIVGLGAFGDKYEGKADFSNKLQSYWDTFFDNLNATVNFTPSLDDVRLF